MSFARSLYGRLPYALRVGAASAWGAYLQHWRYGKETEELIAEAEERERWSPDRWEAWRRQRLSYVLARAATRVPYYREHWAERRRRGDVSSWEDLRNWPVLRKETVRKASGAFVADDCAKRKMLREHTSGTTGTPLSLWTSRKTARGWYALFELRIRRWNGESLRSRWAHVGGQLVASIDRKEPPFWVWNGGMRQLYLSSYHLSPGNVSHYIDALRAHRVRYVLGYASSLYSLARLALEAGLNVPKLEVAISNAEPLYAYQRDVIQRAFDCPVKNTYGMSEIVAGGSECAHGRLHLWPEVGHLEILSDDGDEPAPPLGAGRLVCTSLLNDDMPLIRYLVGDRAAIDPASACRCGRELPSLSSVEGRLDDVIVTPEGRRVGRLDTVFKADLPIREAQIAQLDRDRIEVRIVPADGFGPTHAREITRALGERLGGMAIETRTVSEIPRAPNGKFRGVVGLGRAP